MIDMTEFRKFVTQKEAKRKTRFIGHEGVSAFKSLDVMNKTNLTDIEKINIFKIISMHGTLFNYIKADQTIKEKNVKQAFKGEKTLLSNLVHQVRADVIGRFNNTDSNAEYNFVKDLPKHFQSIIDDLEEVQEEIEGRPILTVLVGAPCSRKSTWIKDNATDEVIISRDNLVVEVGAKYGCKNYTESFQFLNDNREIETNEVSLIIEKTVQDAKRAKKDIIVDMTNMSKKARRRWINTLGGYNKRCKLFLSSYNDMLKCNKKREEETGKSISPEILLSMCKRFSLPMYGEGFNKIDYIMNK